MAAAFWTIIFLWRRLKRIWFALTRLRYHRSLSLHALGIGWHLDLRDGLQRELAQTGDYEPEVRAAILEELRPGDVFVDVGANIGVLSLPIASERPDIHVFAFEPVTATAEKFHETQIRARIKNVTLCRFALGADHGLLQLRKDPWFGNRDTGVVSAHGIGRIAETVEVRRLDDIADDLSLARMDALKVDIEGGEYDALRGMEGLLRRARPRIVVVEVQEALLARAGVPGGAVEELLTSAGYFVRRRLGRNLVFYRTGS